MKIRRINKVTSLAVVLLAAGLLISCKPIFEKKPIPKEGDKAAAAEPNAGTVPAPLACLPARLRKTIVLKYCSFTFRQAFSQTKEYPP